MNKLSGILMGIQTNGYVSLADVAVGPDVFTAILLETPHSATYLQAGGRVEVLFKETEVSLAKGLSGQISLRNRLEATVQGIRYGEILCEITLDYRGQALTSIITARAVERLALQTGDAVEALIKANEVTLRECGDGL